MKKFLLLTTLLSINVYADPTYDVTRGALQNNPDLCSYGYNSSCNHGYTSLPPTKIIQHITVNVPSKYGALASSMGNITGILDQNSKNEAIQGAKARCEKYSKGKPCKVIVWVKNGCVAAAAGSVKGKAFLTHAAEVPGKAESVALSRCQAKGASDCKIIMPEGCSVPDGMYD